MITWSLHRNRSGHEHREDFGRCNTSLHLRLGKGPQVDNRGILVHLGPQVDNRGILVHRGLCSVAMHMQMQQSSDLSWGSFT